MVYEKSDSRWRAWLTEEEAARVAEIDAAEEALKPLRIERQMIANRAVQRARYHEKKASPDKTPRQKPKP